MRTVGAYELDDDPARVDLDVVWKCLSTDVYWGKWRDREMIEKVFKNAWRVVGAYEASSGRLVGFARAFSDTIGSAYLADVFVLDEARGKGLGKELVREMIDNGPGAEFRWMLHTADAHELYRPFGFAEPSNGQYMERTRANGQA
ncbi:GNAT family N-acetyltransferase [Amycolatopsis alba]|nr:GNAT family N-acetyltransferase [Amycolatopsis alba]